MRYNIRQMWRSNIYQDDCPMRVGGGVQGGVCSQVPAPYEWLQIVELTQQKVALMDGETDTAPSEPDLRDA